MNILIFKPSYKSSKMWKTIICEPITNSIITIFLEKGISNKTQILTYKRSVSFHNLDLTKYVKYSLEINNNILENLYTKDKTVLNLTVYSILMSKDKKKISDDEYEIKYRKKL